MNILLQPFLLQPFCILMMCEGRSRAQVILTAASVACYASSKASTRAALTLF